MRIELFCCSSFLFELLVQCTESGLKEVLLWPIGSHFVSPPTAKVLSPAIRLFHI